MAYTDETFNQTSSGKNTKSFTSYTYLTTDTLNVVLGANYFNEKSKALRVNDIIIVISPHQTTGKEIYKKIRVSSNVGEVVTVDRQQRIMFFQQYLGEEYLGIAGIQTIQYFPPTTEIGITGYNPISLDFSYVGTLIGGTMSLDIGKNGNPGVPGTITDPPTSPGDLVIVDILGLGPLNSTDSLSVVRDAVAQTNLISMGLSWNLEPIFA